MRISDWSSDVCSSDLGIQTITSESEDGESSINIEFSPTRDVDSAANDVRDRVSGAVDDLPEEALAPEIRKVDADARPIMFRSEEHTSELQSLMRISYAVFCLKKKNHQTYRILIYKQSTLT